LADKGGYNGSSKVKENEGIQMVMYVILLLCYNKLLMLSFMKKLVKVSTQQIAKIA
jgi:hypothetical protein